MTRLRLAFAILSMLFLAACAGSPANGEAAVPPPLVQAGVTLVAPTQQPAPPPADEDGVQTPDTSFEATTYRDDEAGFEFAYPATWTPGYAEGGSRGRTASLVAPDGNTMGITVYLWEPVNDLDAWVDHRRRPLVDSGTTILSDQELATVDGHMVVQITVQTQLGEQALFALTTVGDQYLEMGGTGNLDLLAEIVGTLRFEGDA